MVAYGIKKPSLKTDAEVQAHAAKTFDYSDEILRIESFTGEEEFPLGVNSLPTVRILDGGEVYELASDCTGDIGEFLKTIDLEGNLVKTGTYNDSLWNNQLRPIVNEDFVAPEGKTVAIFYASYLGKLNKDSTKGWLDSRSSNPELEFVLINCDIAN
jgi:hypothetical protein